MIFFEIIKYMKKKPQIFCDERAGRVASCSYATFNPIEKKRIALVQHATS